MAETVMQAASGLCDDGFSWFIPGANCIYCGRFVGRDGNINYETWEMTDVIASLDGECATCLSRLAAASPVSEQKEGQG